MSTILVVDDNEQNLYMIEILLKKHGYQVSLAKNGVEALNLARKNPPDIVVSDILMPVMDGFTLCREWKSDKTLQHIPFVFYTATYTDEKDCELALNLGADEFIIKPEDPDKLVKILLTVIEKNRTHKIEPFVELGKDDEKFFKQYNEVLINKLESKMLQLSQSLADQQRSAEEIKRLNTTLEVKVSARTAQLQDANKELESFSYSVSHDLKAPLRAIDGFMSILEQDHSGQLDDEGKRIMGVIKKYITTMNKLIDDMLNFSQLAHSDISSEEIDMAGLAKAVWDDMKSYYTGREIEVIINNLPAAKGDPVMIRQVFTNLISNAVKFSAGKNIARIEIGGEKIEDYNRYYVKDNGVGFDMKYAGRLFGVFQRLHSADDFEGTGVGLAIVQRIVNRHGGKVWAESKPGEGAKFYFTLK